MYTCIIHLPNLHDPSALILKTRRQFFINPPHPIYTPFSLLPLSRHRPLHRRHEGVHVVRPLRVRVEVRVRALGHFGEPHVLQQMRGVADPVG